MKYKWDKKAYAEHLAELKSPIEEMMKKRGKLSGLAEKIKSVARKVK